MTNTTETPPSGRSPDCTDLEDNEGCDFITASEWTITKKRLHTMTVSILGFVVTCASSIISPAIQDIAAGFATSDIAAMLTLSLYVLELGLGPAFAAPLSERFGRSTAYKTTLVLFLLFILGAGLGRTFPTILICRLLAGCSGGPVLAIGAGSIADIWKPHERMIPATIFTMMPFLGPSLGPVLGGFLTQYRGWRWTQWVTIFMGVAMLVPTAMLTETHGGVKKRGRSSNITKALEGRRGYVERSKNFIVVALLHPLELIVVEPIVSLLSLYTAFVFSILFGFFSVFPHVFGTVYGFRVSLSGLAFLPIGFGVLVGACIVVIANRANGVMMKPAIAAHTRGVTCPEQYLRGAQLGSFFIPIGLFCFAWTARSDVHWIFPMLAGAPFAAGNMVVFVSSALYLITTYGALHGASAIAANGLLRYSMAAAFPLFMNVMLLRLGIAWSISLFGFVSIAMVPLPFIFDRWGSQIRTRSQFAQL